MSKESFKKIRDKGLWILLNAGFIALLYESTIVEPPSIWGANIIKFFIYLTLVASIINVVIYLIKPTKADRAVHLYVDAVFDMLVVFWLAGAGWFLYAALYVAHIPLYVFSSGHLLQEEVPKSEQCKFIWIKIDQPEWTVRCYKELGHQESHEPPGILDSDMVGQWVDTSSYNHMH